MKNYTEEMLSQIKDLLDISIALSSESDYDKILEKILTEARTVTKAEAGTIFLREGNHLKFEISQNDSLDIYKSREGEKIDLPKVPISKDTVSGYAVITKTCLNIEDVYQTAEFDFSGPQIYDKLTGYKTKSMLVVPLEDHRGKVIGVLQLINAQNEAGEIISFPLRLEKVIKALASQAAISLSTNKYLGEIQNLLYSVVKVTVTISDQRSSYNTNHSYRIVKRTNKIAELIDQADEGPFSEVCFDEERKEQLIMAAWLHDIGKIVIPLSILNKETRLGEKLPLILQRLDYIQKSVEMQYWKKKAEGNTSDLEKWYKKQSQQLTEARNLIKKVNTPDTFVDQQMIAELEKISNLTYIDVEGNEKNWLKEEEVKALSIQRGTLTGEERKLIEKHVEFGVNILDSIPLPEKLERVPDLISLHHELLDGSGYPRGLEGKEISLEGRILALMDIFDALVASDRPYRKSLTSEEALAVLEDMVDRNKLDQDIFELFKEEDVAYYLNDEEDDFLDLKEITIK